MARVMTQSLLPRQRAALNAETLLIGLAVLG